MVYAVEVHLDVWGLLLYGVPFIIVAGWFSSRILGIKRGWGRSVFAGLCGWIFGVLIAAVAQNSDVRSTSDLNDILALAFFFGVRRVELPTPCDGLELWPWHLDWAGGTQRIGIQVVRQRLH